MYGSSSPPLGNQGLAPGIEGPILGSWGTEIAFSWEQGPRSSLPRSSLPKNSCLDRDLALGSWYI